MRPNLLLFLVVIILAWSVTFALAHQAPSGWFYPYICCSNMDCREVPPGFIRETPMGFQISTTGELIPYNDKKVHNSPDGKWHWCSRSGQDTTPTICIFAPFGGS